MQSEGLEFAIELANGLLGVAAFVAVIALSRRSFGGIASGWRWLAAGIAAFSLSELHVLSDFLGVAAAQAAAIAYRLLQAAFVVLMIVGLGIQLRSAKGGPDDPGGR